MAGWGRSKRAVLLGASLISIVGFGASLRILAIEAIIPAQLRWDTLRLFKAHDIQIEKPSRIRSTIRNAITDSATLHYDYALCRSDAGQSGEGVLSSEHCAELLRKAALTTPTDGRLWLEYAIAVQASHGMTAEAVEALKMSYHMAPREGWISGVRLRFSQRVWERLPVKVQQLAVGDITDPWKQFEFASQLLQRDVPRAMELLQSLAQAGESYAQEKLGQIYLEGTLVAADAQKAREYLERAMAAGNLGAQAKLGEALITGRGQPKDQMTGVKLLEAAAATNSWAQYLLGNLLVSGDLPRDVGRAVSLLEAAAKTENPYALDRLGTLYLTGDGVTADAQKAREYLERAKTMKLRGAAQD
jgi:hypothetical protein